MRRETQIGMKKNSEQIPEKNPRKSGIPTGNAGEYFARHPDSTEQKLTARIRSVIRRRAKQVGHGDQQRERHAGIEAEERHGDDLEVLRREDGRRGGEQNDDGEVDPPHGRLLIVDQHRGAQSATNTSTASAQAEAYSDPACTGHDKIDAEEQAEDIEARDRPSRQNQEAEQQRDHAR